MPLPSQTQAVGILPLPCWLIRIRPVVMLAPLPVTPITVTMGEIFQRILAQGRGHSAKSVTFRRCLEGLTMIDRSEKCRRVELLKRVLPLRTALSVVLCSLLSVLISACAAPMIESKPVIETGAFNVFLQPLPQETHRLSFAISELVSVRENGETLSLKLRHPTINQEYISTAQQKLVSATLPPGRYSGLRLRVDTA